MSAAGYVAHQPVWRGPTRRAAAATVIALVAGVLPASAQRPHGVPPGLAKKGNAAPDTNGGSSGGNVLTGPSVRSFGVWLDDASVLGPREAWLTISMQRWASPVLRGFDVPISDVSVGVVPRLHAFASVPFTQYAYAGAPLEGQIGDAYFGAKYVLREPDEGRLGLAVTPAVEILSTAAIADTGLSRVNLVLPFSAEWRLPGARVYGSTGYFTRGAYFAAGAVERAVNERWLVTGALTYSRATSALETSETWGLSHQRVDGSGSVAWIVTDRLVLFGGLSRTLSHLDLDGTRYAATFGTSMDLGRLPTTRRPPVRP